MNNNMSELNHWKYFGKYDFSGYTLIISSVAVGNVGQLACDLLISSLDMKRIAMVYSPALIPISGYNPYKTGSTTITSCCELYISEQRKIIILLLRAPLVHKYGQQFLTEVVDKFKTQNIKDIIILTSSYAHEKKHIMTSLFRYAVNDLCPHISIIQNLKWEQHESDDKAIKVLGGGFASLLYEIATNKAVPCLMLYKFSSEGDNIPDAYEMVQYLNSVLPLFDEANFCSKLVHPVSWNLMFGRPPPANIY